MKSYRAIAALATMVAAILLAPSPTLAAKKVALVIGNGAYSEAPLKNPPNDARAIAATLRRQGFEVLIKENATKSQMNEIVADFGEKIGEGDTALFFFAGHGMQVQGRNYLIPIDARITSEQRVRLETLDVEAVLDQMAAARAKVSMVILDACRNNPFERRFRSVGGGLAQINAPEGTMIAYATAPGKVAADGEGSNGLYTQELLKALAQPGLKVEEVFKQVRIGVTRASNGAQVPWEASSLTGDFYFEPARASAPAGPQVAALPAPAQAVPAPAAPLVDREAMFWDAVKGSNDPSELRAYLEAFPNGTFAPLARARAASLEAQRQQVASAGRTAPTPAPAPAPATAPAQQQVAAAPAVRAGRALNGQFAATVPSGVFALGQPVYTHATVENGAVRISATLMMMQGYRCSGVGAIGDDRIIPAFDVVCTTGGNTRTVEFAGVMNEEGGSRTIKVKLTDPQGKTVEVTFK